jgi:hypothetical protein
MSPHGGSLGFKRPCESPKAKVEIARKLVTVQPGNPVTMVEVYAKRSAELSLVRSTNRVLEASLSCVLVLSRVPQPFSQLVALALGAIGAGALADTVTLSVLARVATLACALVLGASCLWARFVLPFIFRAVSTHDAPEPRPPSACAAAGPCATALAQLPDDVALQILLKLPLVALGRFGRCSRATRALSIAPDLWRRIVVPDQIESISRALGALPPSLRGQPCTIAIRAGVYVEGQRSRLQLLLGMDCSPGVGLRISRPVVLEPAAADDTVVIESDASEAICLLPGAEGSVLRRLTVRTVSFASHAVAIYAHDVRLEGCALRAAGRNSCGVVVTGSGVRASVSGCAISGCGGGGVLLAYGVGPILIADTSIVGNGWSGIGAFSGASLVLARCEIRANKMYAVGVARDVSVTLRDQTASMDDNDLGGLHRYLAPPLHPQIAFQSR